MSPASLLKILVVDDDVEVTDYLSATLRELEFEVNVANTGEQALSQLNEINFDLVITDLVMPGMSGFDLMTELHSRFSSIPIIVLSGHDSRDMMREAMKHGAYDFLAKPLSLEELKVTVRNALENQRSTTEKKRAEADLEKLRSFIGAIESRKSQPDPFLPKIFRGWRRDEYMAIRMLGKETAVPLGTEISWDSANESGLIIVQSGRFSVERGGYNIMLLFAGDSWGAPSIINFSMRPVKLVAETETRIVRIPLQEILAFFRQHEERLFKIFVLNVVYTVGEWLEISFDRVVKQNIYTGGSSTITR